MNIFEGRKPKTLTFDPANPITCEMRVELRRGKSVFQLISMAIPNGQFFRMVDGKWVDIRIVRRRRKKAQWRKRR